MIFATKIKSVKFVVDFLRRQNTPVEMLHGQLPQSQREKTLADFKAGKTNTLVTTPPHTHSHTHKHTRTHT